MYKINTHNNAHTHTSYSFIQQEIQFVDIQYLEYIWTVGMVQVK